MNPQLDIGVNLSGSDQFAADAKVTQDALVKMDGQAKRIIQTQKNLSKQSGQLRGVFGQLGYQVQDVAVQLQMGQNAMMVFGQQGSQVLSIFGGWGAIAGAVVAVGSALYTASQVASLSREKMDELSDALDSVAAKYKKATGAARDLARIELATKMDDLRKSIATSAQEMDTLNVKLGSAARRGDEKEVEKLTKAYRLLGIENAANSERLAEFEKLLKVTSKAEQDTIDAAEASKKATTEKIDALWDEYQTYGMSAEQLVAYTLKKQGATEAQIEEAVALQRSIVELENENKAREKAVEAMRKQAEEEARLAAKIAKAKKDQETSQAFEREAKVWDDLGALESELAERYKTEANAIRDGEALKLSILEEARKADIISAEKAEAMKRLIQEESAEAQKAITISNAMNAASAAQNQLNILASVFGEGSAMAKAAFVANQAIAAANAIVSAEAASAKALEFLPPPFNIPMAATIKGLGYAAAGAIAGQTIASFEGGGLTGSGVRSGGIDGKGGMIAMLHPNEKVTDLTKGGGESQPVNVNFSISAVDAEGFDKLLATRQGMIVNMINRAVNNSGRRSLV